MNEGFDKKKTEKNLIINDFEQWLTTNRKFRSFENDRVAKELFAVSNNRRGICFKLSPKLEPKIRIL